MNNRSRRASTGAADARSPTTRRWREVLGGTRTGGGLRDSHPHDEHAQYADRSARGVLSVSGHAVSIASWERRAGLRRGGDGLVREITLLEPGRRDASHGASTVPQRGASREGVRVDAAGIPRAGTGRRRDLPGRSTCASRRGDAVRLETPGGGGWGKPRNKDNAGGRFRPPRSLRLRQPCPPAVASRATKVRPTSRQLPCRRASLCDPSPRVRGVRAPRSSPHDDVRRLCCPPFRRDASRVASSASSTSRPRRASEGSSCGRSAPRLSPPASR